MTESMRRLLTAAVTNAKRKLLHTESKRTRRQKMCTKKRTRAVSGLTTHLPKRRKKQGHYGSQAPQPPSEPPQECEPVCMCMPPAISERLIQAKRNTCGHVAALPFDVWQEILQYLTLDSHKRFFRTHPLYIQQHPRILTAGRLRFEWADATLWWCRRMKKTVGVGRRKYTISRVSVDPPYPYTPAEAARTRSARRMGNRQIWEVFDCVCAFIEPAELWGLVCLSKVGLTRLCKWLSTNFPRPPQWFRVYWLIRRTVWAIAPAELPLVHTESTLPYLPIFHSRLQSLYRQQRPAPVCTSCQALVFQHPVTPDLVMDTCPCPGFQFLYKYKVLNTRPRVYHARPNSGKSLPMLDTPTPE